MVADQLLRIRKAVPRLAIAARHAEATAVEVAAQRRRLGAAIDEYIDVHVLKLEERRRMLQADADMMARKKSRRLGLQAVSHCLQLQSPWRIPTAAVS